MIMKLLELLFILSGFIFFTSLFVTIIPSFLEEQEDRDFSKPQGEVINPKRYLVYQKKHIEIEPVIVTDIVRNS